MKTASEKKKNRRKLTWRGIKIFGLDDWSKYGTIHQDKTWRIGGVPFDILNFSCL